VKYQQTMDFIGFGPIHEKSSEELPLANENILNYFYLQDGLSQYLEGSAKKFVRGFIIEVKSRSIQNFWKPFQYSFSPNQEEMFKIAQRYNFDIVLCGVTFGENWEISVIFTNLRGKILPSDFLTRTQ
jgi:hypothetical protein